MTDDFFGVVARQRAYRAYAPDDVDDATIARILTAATFAPSAENKQPWEFVVVRDAATRGRDRVSSPGGRGRPTAAPSPRAASRRRCSPTSAGAQPAASRTRR